MTDRHGEPGLASNRGVCLCVGVCTCAYVVEGTPRGCFYESGPDQKPARLAAGSRWENQPCFRMGTLYVAVWSQCPLLADS